MQEDAAIPGARAAAGLANGALRYVQWTPVIAGALAAAALSFVLFTFGSSLGIALSSSSPSWRDASIALAILSGLYIILTTVASFGLGGYIAGRLRSRWAATQAADEDEIEFRDGIHGLLVWALAVALGALLAAAAAAAMASTSAPAASLPNATAGEPIIAYDLDRLFRSQQAPSPAADLSYSRAEAARIAMRAASRRDSSDLAEDRAHLLRIVSVRIGLTGANAEARVGDFIENEGHQEGSSERGRGGVHDCRGPCPRGGHRVVRVRRGWQPSRRDAFVPQLAAHPLATVGVIAV
jgi:hypothetical protein